MIAGPETKDSVSVATPWQLMLWRFQSHRLALIGLVVVTLFFAIAVFAPLIAYADPQASNAQRGLIPPQPIRFFDAGAFRPHVLALNGARDPNTLQRIYKPNPQRKIPVRLFAEGFEYRLLGIFPTRRHLVGLEGVKAEDGLALLGTDVQGRDLFSRLMLGTRISMTIGLVSVLLSLTLGVFFGGLSGLYGGLVDSVIQRVIEILRSIPTIPLWMGLAAALPREWSIIQVYFAITIIISLIGWTELARVVRGKFLSLREEEFVMAAELAGCSRPRIIFSHLVPNFLSHIIAATTLAIPAMILTETALSFLGIGLRPPAISWGVLLQQSQNVQTVALSPWLMLPAVPVLIIVLAFNFLGDGLRDAADPYGL